MKLWQHVRSPRDNGLVKIEKDLEQNSEKYQHSGWAEDKEPAKAAREVGGNQGSAVPWKLREETVLKRGDQQW